MVIGKTYFFKGKVFWEFNDRRMKVVSPTPSLSATYWMSCPNGMPTSLDGQPAQADRPAEEHYKASRAPTIPAIPAGVVVAMVFLVQTSRSH